MSTRCRTELGAPRSQTAAAVARGGGGREGGGVTADRSVSFGDGCGGGEFVGGGGHGQQLERHHYADVSAGAGAAL